MRTLNTRKQIWEIFEDAAILQRFFFCAFKTDAKELNKVIPEKLDIRKNENKNSLTSFKACPEVLIQAIFRQDLQFYVTENIFLLSEAYFETIKEIVTRYFAFQWTQGLEYCGSCNVRRQMHLLTV